MQSIGERLEEARKRRGISVREAAEATKIRGDFLVGFESNQFEIGLPDLYVRGFLRNYAQFLKADADKIVTDYNAVVIGETKILRKENRELFGRLEIPEQKRPAGDGTSSHGQSERRRADEGGDNPRPGLSPELANYIKIGAIVLAGVLAILFIVWLVQLIIQSASQPNAGAESGAAPAEAQTPLETITLIALDNVRVKVTQEPDGRELFNGPLAKGETRQIAKRGRIIVLYDAGRNLQIEKEGKRYQMPSEDYGKSWFE